MELVLALVVLVQVVVVVLILRSNEKLMTKVLMSDRHLERDPEMPSGPEGTRKLTEEEEVDREMVHRARREREFFGEQ